MGLSRSKLASGDGFIENKVNAKIYFRIEFELRPLFPEHHLTPSLLPRFAAERETNTRGGS